MNLLQNSLSGAVLIGLIALIRKGFLGRLPKNTFCVLWVGAALRLLVPVTIPSRCSIFTLLGSLFRKQSGSGEYLLAAMAMEAAPGGVSGAAGSRFPLLRIFWLTGACILAGYFLIAYIRKVFLFRDAVPVNADFLAVPGVKPLFPVRIRQSERVAGPLTYGIFRPVVLLPKSTDWQDREALSMVLAHEYTHIRRLDNGTKLLFLCAACLHWFNPAVWLLLRLANRDLELACDEQTIRSLGADSRFRYARLLLNQAEKAPGNHPLFSLFGARSVQERVTSALSQQRRSAWRSGSACLLVAGVLILFGTGAAAAPGGTDSTAGVFPEGVDGQTAFCISCVSGNGSDSSESLLLTTSEGEQISLTPQQVFLFRMTEESAAQGVVNGYVMESTAEGGQRFVTYASADLRLISQTASVHQIWQLVTTSKGGAS